MKKFMLLAILPLLFSCKKKLEKDHEYFTRHPYEGIEQYHILKAEGSKYKAYQLCLFLMKAHKKTKVASECFGETGALLTEARTQSMHAGAKVRATKSMAEKIEIMKVFTEAARFPAYVELGKKRLEMLKNGIDPFAPEQADKP